MKKNVTLLIVFSFLAIFAKSQSYQFLYYLDENLVTTPKSAAIIMGKGLKENGLFRLDCYSMPPEPQLLAIIHFTDSLLGKMEGPYCRFHPNGKRDREGSYHQNNETGIWKSWDSLGRLKDSIVYEQGKEMFNFNYRYSDNGDLLYYSVKDSLADTLHTYSYTEKGDLISEVFFKGQRGVWISYTETDVEVDSVYTREEIEADFPGGETGWMQYLQQNLNANVPVDKHAPEGTYQVFIKFIIETDGSISNVVSETKLGFGMEKEVTRIITKGPRWIPAVQYGRKVKAYRRQPVTFVVSSK